MRIAQKVIMIILISKVKLLMEGTGSKRAISMSKIRNKTAKIKNRSEKGIRAELWGSNPHSKGEDFSRLKVIFLLSRKVAMITMVGTIAAIIIDKKIVSIILGEYLY